MITEITEYTQHFTIRSHESDIHNSASLYAMSNYLQEVARVHAEELKLGIQLLREKQKFWVLTRKIIEIEHYPVQGSRIQVRTWPKGIDKIFALRDFEIWQNEQIICRATSSWALLDLKSRRPAHVSEIGTVMFERENIHAIERRADKLASAKPDFELNHRVTYSELDLNGHVNNTRYINWLMDTFTTVYHKEHVVSRVQTNYLAEVFPDQEITILRQEIHPDHFLFEIRTKESKPLFRGELLFKTINTDN